MKKRFTVIFLSVAFAFCSLTAQGAGLTLFERTIEPHFGEKLYISTVHADESKLITHFIDVGQGDSEFIELPNGKTMLIDAGTSEYGEAVAGYIKDLGYNTVDYLVATHPHADHIGGMPEVFEQLNIKSVYMPNAVTDSKTFERMLSSIENEGCDVYEAKAGMNMFSDGKLNADILSPVDEKYNDLNNYSVMIMLSYGEIDYLFTGDCEALVENQVIGGDISAEILKVGHHGSNTSSSNDFIRQVAPEIAVISCGKNNSYGHPHGETLSTLNSLGIKILRTDESGTVIISTDGENVNFNGNTYSAKSDNSQSGAGNGVYYASSNSFVSNSVADEKEENKETEIVYITKTGKKYHKLSCSYLKESIEKISLVKALEKGLEPCSRCKP